MTRLRYRLCLVLTFAFIYGFLNLSASEVDVALAVKAAAPGAMFYDSEPLLFDLDIPGKASMTVVDVFGTEYASQEVSPGKLQLPKLDRGYYYIELQSKEYRTINRRSFAVVPPRASLPTGKESNFAIDLAQYSTGKPDPRNTAIKGPVYSILNQLCARSGIFTARDRNGWRESAPGKYGWEQQKINAEELAALGITVTGSIQGSPEWTRSGKLPFKEGSKGKGRHLLPDDLRNVYNYTQAFARDFKDTVKYCEFWNEPEGGADPIWEYAAASKAAFLGFRAGNPDLTVLSGSFYTISNPGRMYTALDNGIGEYFDIYNYHTYKNLSLYPEVISSLRKMLKKYGIENRAIFLTENSLKCDGEATQESYVPGIKAHSFEQEMLQAEFTIKSQILMQSLGIAIDYTFVMRPYSETNGAKDWGLARRDYTAKPALAAFAALCNVLAPADYLGTRDCSKQVRGFLYRQPSGIQTLALWRRSELDEKGSGIVKYAKDKPEIINLKVPGGEYLLHDFFGRVERLQAKRGTLAVPVGHLPRYLTGNLKLRPQKKSPGRGIVGAGESRYERSIVLRAITGKEFPIDSSGGFVRAPEKKGSLVLEVYNFGTEDKTGRLLTKGGTVEGIPAEITVPAGDRIELPLKFTPEEIPGKIWAGLAISGIFADKPVLPVVIPIQIPSDSLLSKALGGTATPANWRNNASGNMSIGKNKTEKAVSFIADFTVQDRWIYPEYVLSSKESLKGAVGLSFQIRIRDAKAAQKIATGIVYFVDSSVKGKSGKSCLSRYLPPKDDKWATIKVYFTPDMDMKASDIKLIRIGIHPKTDHIEYELRNINGLYEKR